MVLRTCPNCLKTYETDLPGRPEGDRRPIQEIYPSAERYQREQLQTGFCSDKCWDQYLRADEGAVYDEKGKWISGGWREEE